MKSPQQQRRQAPAVSDLDNEAIGCMTVILIVGALSILAGIYTAPI